MTDSQFGQDGAITGEVTDEFIESAARNWLNTDLARSLQARGVEFIRSDTTSNYIDHHKMSMRFSKPSDKKVLMIMGKGVYDSKNPSLNSGEINMAQKGYRTYKKIASSYLEFIKPLDAWHYWQEKGFADFDESKAAVAPEDMAETGAGFAAGDPDGFFSSNITEGDFEKFREPMIEILEEWNELFSTAKTATPGDKQSWWSSMKWNRNSGHPYHFSIPEERFESVDWPNFRDWITKMGELITDEQVSEFMATSPGSVPNANAPIYTAFHRSPDRLIHGIRLLLKPPGAMVTSSTTDVLKQHDIAWHSVENIRMEAAEALADASCISADDLLKFDKSLHPFWFKLIYECFWASGFLNGHPKLRAIFGCLIYDLTHDNLLRWHPSWLMNMRSGLYSGHGLTQWIGSLIHLVLYRYWKHTLSMEPVWQKVLSDDGIQIYSDISPSEMAILHETMQEDLQTVGMSLHPVKTKIVDPTVEVYVGQLDGNDMYMHNSTYFLKQNLQRQMALSHGNPMGVVPSFYQKERNPSEDALRAAEVQASMVGAGQLNLGGQPSGATYDLARIVDILASCGRGNPLVEDQLQLVQNAWPGFWDRGVDILEHKLDQSWRSGTTRYAGGTLDSGLTRDWAVEALLNPDDYKVWDDIVFRE